MRLFIVLILFTATSFYSHSQTDPVEVVRSEDKVVIGGTVYYIHIVKPGQTWYSISRVYNVPQKEILLENPHAYVGLQPGQALKIPVMPETDEEDILTGDPPKDYIVHTVEQGQTLFFLSRTYNVDQDEIIRLNPGVEEGLQIGQEVKIPSRRIHVPREGFPVEEDKYIYHKVERGETLYSLSRKYEVPVRAIRKANDKLIWGLKYGEYIRIPRELEADIEELEIPDPELPVDETAEEPWPPDLYEEETVIEADCIHFDYREFDRPFRVALLLPLFIDRNYPVELPDTLDKEDAVALIDSLYPEYVKSLDELYHNTIPYLEFYEGAFLALDSLQRTGLSVKLSIHDTERNPQKVRDIIWQPEFRNNDLVIGPVYPENMRVVADWANHYGVNIVSPLTSRREFLSDNPYLFQVTPSASVELEQASIFITNFPSSNFVLLHKDDFFERDLVEAFKNNIFRHFSYGSEFDNLVFKEVIYRDATTNIEQSLVSGEKNIVIIPSSDQAFVSDVLMRLNILSRSYDITIFGLNDWQRFPNIEVEYLHNMELHFASPFYIDYDDENVRRFIGRFRDKYYTEPSDYAFLGYDIMFYFLQALKNFGPDFRECLPVMRTALLHSEYLFRKSDYRSGLENNGISIVKYGKDMNIKRLGLNALNP